MSDAPTTTDVLAIRQASLENFRQHARSYFARAPEVQSMVLAVSQYFADEAGDAVHEQFYSFITAEPTWPHTCNGDEKPTDGSRCSYCADLHEEGEWYLRPGTDSNTDGVTAWSAFCTEWGGGEGESENADPVAIARRGPDGEVELELVHEVVRPWLDDNHAGEARDEDNWDEAVLPPAPEPQRAPWSTDERALLDAVLAQPLDDGPRRVLVDHWLERNGVRGEYGVLSFKSERTSAERQRLFALEAEHARRWLGPLQPGVTLGGLQLARGPFAARVVVAPRAEVDLVRLADVDEWALIEAMRIGGENAFFSRHQRGLRELTGLNQAALDALEKSGLSAPITTVGLLTQPSDSRWPGTLGGVKRLIIEQQSSPLERGWQKMRWWSQLEQVEVWFTSGEQGQQWHDARGERALAQLREVLPTTCQLTVGYHLGNGARRGLVARLVNGVVTLEPRSFTRDSVKAAAEERLAGLAPAAPAAPGPAKPASEGALGRLLSWFRR